MTAKSRKSPNHVERHQSTTAAEQQQSDEDQPREKAPVHQLAQKQRRKRAARSADGVSSSKDNTATGKSRPDVEADNVNEEAKDNFVMGVLTRGEAAQPEQEELGPGQTHRIVGEDESGKPKVERERFSLY